MICITGSGCENEVRDAQGGRSNHYFIFILLFNSLPILDFYFCLGVRAVGPTVGIVSSYYAAADVVA